MKKYSKIISLTLTMGLGIGVGNVAKGKCVCMFSHGNRIGARKSAFHHKVATNDRNAIYYNII